MRTALIAICALNFMLGSLWASRAYAEISIERAAGVAPDTASSAESQPIPHDCGRLGRHRIQSCYQGPGPCPEGMCKVGGGGGHVWCVAFSGCKSDAECNEGLPYVWPEYDSQGKRKRMVCEKLPTGYGFEDQAEECRGLGYCETAPTRKSNQVQDQAW